MGHTIRPVMDVQTSVDFDLKLQSFDPKPIYRQMLGYGLGLEIMIFHK